MWELYHGVRAWDGLNHAQVIHAVAIMNSGLEFSPSCPASYQKLSKRCMSVDPDLRPTFEKVVSQIQSLESEFKAESNLPAKHLQRKSDGTEVEQHVA